MGDEGAAGRRRLVVEARDAASPEIGRWLWVLEDTRRETADALAGITPAALDWTGAGAGESNSIGSLLYHIAVIEADWLYVEVLERPVPEEIQTLFPLEARDDRGHLSRLHGRDLAAYARVLDATRAALLAAFRPMAPDDFHRARRLPDYDVTPAWVLHHLVQHEAEHRGQLMVMRERAEAALAGGGTRGA
ncbi:MAG TPA: DinB family protein [Thermomicrobiales bacterium]|nr:DinB family protein [Thermomicrobiales bacterium]